MFDNYKTLVEEHRKFQAEFEKKMQNSFNEIFTEFFEKVPEVKTIAWQQIIPYFNDGEECVFSRGGISLFLEELTHDEVSDVGGFWEDGGISLWVPGNYDWKGEQLREYNSLTEDEKTVRTLSSLLIEFLNEIPDDIFQQTFGSHARIVVTRNGVDVEEYVDHD
jgi:hypothetical protein